MEIRTYVKENLDNLLDKINKSGIGSLSDWEREELRRYSSGETEEPLTFTKTYPELGRVQFIYDHTEKREHPLGKKEDEFYKNRVVHYGTTKFTDNGESFTTEIHLYGDEYLFFFFQEDNTKDMEAPILDNFFKAIGKRLVK